MDGRRLSPDDGSSRRPRRGSQTHRGKESRLLQGVQPLLTRFLEGTRGGGDSNTSTPNRRRRTRVPDRGRPHSGDDDNHSATSSCGGGFMKRMMRKIHVQRKDNSSKSRYDEEEEDDNYEGEGEEDTLDDAPRGDGGDAAWCSPDAYGGAGDSSDMVKDANNMGNVHGQPFMRNTPQMPHIMSKQQQQLQQARVSTLMHRGHVVNAPVSGGGGGGGVTGIFLPVLANTAAVNGHGGGSGGVASTPMSVPTAGAPPSATAQGPFNRLGVMSTGVSNNGGGGGGAGSIYNTDMMLSMDGTAPRGGGNGGGNGDAALATVMNSAGGSSNSSNDSGGGGLGRSGIMMPSIFGYDRMARGHDAYTSPGDGNLGNAPSRHSTGNDLYNSRYFGGLQQNNSRSSIHSRMSLNRGSNTSMGSIASTGPRMIPYNVQPFRWVPRVFNRIQVMRTYAARQGHTYAAMLQTKVENNMNNSGKNHQHQQQQQQHNNWQHPPPPQPSSAEYRRRGNGDGYTSANGGNDNASDHDMLYTTGSYVSYNSNDIGMDISDTQDLMQQQEQQRQIHAAESAVREQQLLQLQHAMQQTQDAIALRRQQYQQREQERQQNQAMQLQNQKYDAYDDAIHAWQNEQRNTVPDDNDNDSNDGGDGGALVKFDATKSVLKCAHELKLYSFYGPIGTIGVRASQRREAWERSSGNEGIAERIYIVRCNDRANVGPGKTMDSILLLTRMWCDPKLLLEAQVIDSPDVSDDDDEGAGANEGNKNVGQDGDSEQQQQQQQQQRRRRKGHNTNVANDDDDDAHDKKQQQQSNGNKVDGVSSNNNGTTAASPTRRDDAKNAAATASPQTARTAQQQGAISTAPSTATTMTAQRGVAASTANMMPGAISVYGLLPAHCTSERHLGDNNNTNSSNIKTTPDSAPTARGVTSSSCYSEGQTVQSNPSTAHALPRVSAQSSNAKSSVAGTAVSSSSPATQMSASPVAPTLSHRTLHDEDKTHHDGDSNTTSVGDSSSSRSNNNSGGGGSDDGDDGYNSPATSDSDDDDADTARKARSGLLGASTEDGLRHSVMLASSLYLPQTSTTNLTTPNSVVSHTAASVHSTTAAAAVAATATAKTQRERTLVSSPHKTAKSTTVTPPTLPMAKTAPSANNSKTTTTATTATTATTTAATSDNKTATATQKHPHSPTSRPQALPSVSETPSTARPTAHNAPRPSKPAVSTANVPHNNNNNINKSGNSSSSHTTATAPAGTRSEMDGEYPGVPLF